MEDHLNLTDTVQQAGLKEFLSVEPDDSIRDVFAALQEKRFGCCLICHDGKLLGIFTEHDALNLMASGDDLSARIDTVMVADPETLPVTGTVAKAIAKMSRGSYRRLPVVDETGRPVGLITVSGIVHFLVEHFPQTVYNLPPEPNPVTQEREGA